MKRSRLRSKMKLIAGGNQLSLIKDSEEVLKFLDLIYKNHVSPPELFPAIRSQCETCFSLLMEDEDSCDWVLNHIDMILDRLPQLSPAQRASYQSALEMAVRGYQAWSADPFGWHLQPATNNHKKKPGKRILTFPFTAESCIEVVLPEAGLTVEDFKRLGLFLYPYCSDLDLTKRIFWDPELPSS